VSVPIESINPVTDDDRPVWGAAAIAAIINRNLRQTYYLLERGQIRCAKKIGRKSPGERDTRQWVASSKRALLRVFDTEGGVQ
jgi:hypothetical protein